MREFLISENDAGQRLDKFITKTLKGLPVSLEQALDAARSFGLKVVDVRRQLERSHIFTHIRWDMRGWFLDVGEMAGGFAWLTLEQIDEQAALPTAFRQFWEER